MGFFLKAREQGANLVGIPMHILVYDDDIVLISTSQEELRYHLDRPGNFCIRCTPTVNLGKTKAMIFHTSRRVRNSTTLTTAEGQVEVVESHVYLDITFASRPRRFTMTCAAIKRLTRGYATLAMLERRYHTHF